MKGDTWVLLVVKGLIEGRNEIFAVASSLLLRNFFDPLVHINFIIYFIFYTMTFYYIVEGHVYTDRDT